MRKKNKRISREMMIWIKRRNLALYNLDVEKMKELSKELDIPVPEDDLDILAGMHKIRLNHILFSKEVKEISRTWLEKYNFSEKI